MEKPKKQDWNKFILENRGSFLQSYEWGEFQEGASRCVFRFEGNGWQAQFVEMMVPVINIRYWYCPRGPIMGRGIKGQEFRSKMEEMMSRVKGAAGRNVIFFRLGPEWEIGQGIEKNLENLSFKKLHYDIEPSQTLILDITKSEEELLAQMHEKWRYNIRLAERKGVEIKNFQFPPTKPRVLDKVGTIPNFQYEAFWNLLEKTSKRQKIKIHPKEYYHKQLEINSEDFKAHLFVAEYESQAIAANIVVFFGQRATYLHGATSAENREAMAPHLLQWKQIREARRRGCAEYDFWGIVNEHTLDKRKKFWEGFTRFKKGFGGREVNYIGCWDYPLDKPWYFLYRLVQKFRR